MFLTFYKQCLDFQPAQQLCRPAAALIHQWDLTFRRFLFRLVRHPYFESFSLCIVCINVIVLSISYATMSSRYEYVLNMINHICTWWFVTEAVLILIALGPAQYLAIGWNRFDLIVAFGSLVDFCNSMGYISTMSFGFNPVIFRVVRLIKIFKVIKLYKGLARLGRTLLFALPTLYNVVIVLFLLFFVYAVAGMSLWSHVKHGTYINDHANFESFTTAMATLFRVMTGERWNGIMRDCMIEPPFCTAGVDCGNTPLSMLYFVSFMLFSSFLVLNVVVAVVLNQFQAELAKDRENSVTPIKEEDVMDFSTQWTRIVGPTASVKHGLTMSVSRLPVLLMAVSPPLGLAGLSDEEILAYANNDTGKPMPSTAPARHHRNRSRIGLGFGGGEHSLITSKVVHAATIATISAPKVHVIGKFIDSLHLPSDQQHVHYIDLIYVLGCKALDRSIRDTYQATFPTAIQRGISVQPMSPLSDTYYGLPLTNQTIQLIRLDVHRQFPQLRSRPWSMRAGVVLRALMVQRWFRRFKARRLRRQTIAIQVKQALKGRQ